MIIIGSECLKYWFPDFPRTPKDLDVVCEKDEKLDLQLSYERVERLENPVLLEYYKGGGKYLPPNLLYTLKISHLFWNLNWEKHMFDVQFLKQRGCTLDRVLFDKLYIYWNEVHGRNKRSDLKMTAEDFFNNALDVEYEHDFIHTLVNPYPSFNKILKDGAEVETDEDKFNELTFEEKCDLAIEEVYVMAWERYANMHYVNAYSKMLKKFIISHAPIWQALFIIENYILLHRPNQNFIKTINDGIRKIKQSSSQLTIS
jgi:hypothetical protein